MSKGNGYILKAENVFKVYNPGQENEVRVLNNVDFKIRKGEFLSIIGPSGSGKTTLLDIIGCLLKPSSGRVFIDGVDIGKLDDNELARIRGKKIGFIFQQYNLIYSLTALENVMLALRIMGKSKQETTRKAKNLLETMGLGKRLEHRPSQLSGGEQQRVAIARALANDPKIILGDEPTGNIDTKTGEKILKLLKHLNREKGYTIILVTHDTRIGKYSDKIIHLVDGEIVKGRRA
jgi:ABC-type lipoprotein export system ATPase subunit